MKGSILQLLIFLLLFISLTVVFCFFGYLLWFDAGYSPYSSDAGSGFFQVMPGLLLSILPLSVLMSVMFSYFITVKRDINRFFSSILIFVFSSAIYLGGFYGLIRFSSGGVEKVSVPAPVVYEKRINPFKKAYVYAESINKFYADGVVSDKNGLVYNGRMERKDLDSMISVPEVSRLSARLDANPYFAGTFQFPGFIKTFYGDISLFNREMVRLYRVSVYYLVLQVMSQIIFAISLWSFLRISRWPLINVFISLILVRGVFAVYPLWNSGFIKEGLSLLPNDILKENFFSVVLVAISLVIFLIDGVVAGLRRPGRDISRG